MFQKFDWPYQISFFNWQVEKILWITTRRTTTFLKIRKSNLLDASYEKTLFFFRLEFSPKSGWTTIEALLSKTGTHFSGIQNWYYVRWCMISKLDFDNKTRDQYKYPVLYSSTFFHGTWIDHRLFYVIYRPKCLKIEFRYTIREMLV